jgi:hypothetical protein
MCWRGGDSLIHDDVLDEADTRRGDLAVHKLYSNKVAVLAGDYLLARASVLLARLENVQVRGGKGFVWGAGHGTPMGEGCSPLGWSVVVS